MAYESDFDEESDSSSISSSSIIDLPPPLSPSRITTPASLSVNRGIDIVSNALDNSPVLGPIVRRTRSARLLGQSWASRMTDNGSNDGNGNGGNEYGTFVRDHERD